MTHPKPQHNCPFPLREKTKIFQIKKISKSFEKIPDCPLLVKIRVYFFTKGYSLVSGKYTGFFTRIRKISIFPIITACLNNRYSIAFGAFVQPDNEKTSKTFKLFISKKIRFVFPARFTILNDKSSFFKKCRKKTEKQTNSKQKYNLKKRKLSLTSF